MCTLELETQFVHVNVHTFVPVPMPECAYTCNHAHVCILATTHMCVYL